MSWLLLRALALLTNKNIEEQIRKTGKKMREDEKGIFAGSKVGKPPSPKKLKQFIDRGGYAILESVGTGTTAEEKQMNGWKKHGAISKLASETRVTRPTLYRIKACFPTFKSTGLPVGIWLKKEDFDYLKDAYSRLNNMEKLCNLVREYFERSLVIDLQRFRVRQQIGGESIEGLQLAIKKELDVGKKERSNVEKILKDALEELHWALIDLHSIMTNLKKV